jgi:hypothetical protein
VPERATDGCPVIAVDDIAERPHRRVANSGSLGLIDERGGAGQGCRAPCSEGTVVEL